MITVGLYCGWDEQFPDLLSRLRRATPNLYGHTYKTLRFVPPECPHTHALVLNAVSALQCPLENTWVVVFEPPEILGDNHPWLDSNHPQNGAHIYSFCEGSQHPVAPALGLVQARIAPPTLTPSVKPLRMSMICSDKTVTPYQVKRRDVLRALLDTDIRIMFYGRNMLQTNDERMQGELPVQDKDMGLRPYVFCIDFENSPRDVLTDKFLDPLLNATVPVTNSPAALKYFPANSYEFIDFNMSVERIVAKIVELYAQPRSHLAKYDAPILQARDLITYGEYNLCEWLYRQIVSTS